jgi:hypothetical protein
MLFPPLPFRRRQITDRETIHWTIGAPGRMNQPAGSDFMMEFRYRKISPRPGPQAV